MRRSGLVCAVPGLVQPRAPFTRRLAAAVVGSALALAGVWAVTAAAPEDAPEARALNSSVSCARNPDGSATCTVTDPDGIRQVHVPKSATDHRDIKVEGRCASQVTIVVPAARLNSPQPILLMVRDCVPGMGVGRDWWTISSAPAHPLAAPNSQPATGLTVSGPRQTRR